MTGVAGDRAGAAAADGAGARIETIEVVGARRASADVIRRHLDLSTGRRPNAADINAAIKRLFDTGLYDDVRIDTDGGTLRVRVSERPLVAKVTIAGNGAIKDDAIAKAAGLAVGTPYSRAAASAAARGVRALYRASGYEDALIDVRGLPLPDGRVAVTVSIKDGAIAKIGEVGFTGNTAYSAGELRDVVTTRPAGVLDVLTGTTYRDEARLALDRVLIVRHYEARGYADVKVAPAQAVRDAASGHWRITFAIDEGNRYRFGRIRWPAPAAGEVDPRTLARHITLRAGDTWSRQAIDAAVERMNGALVDQGHILSEVVASPRRDPVARSIGIDLELRRRSRVTIERVVIEGNRRTRDEVIRREIGFSDGDVHHPLLIERGKRRLERLGLFKSVAVEAGKGAARDGTVVVVKVEEQATNEVGFGIGYSTQEGVIGDVSFSERNLMGRGQQLKLKLAASETRREGEIGFTEPYFLGRKLAAGFDLFYRDLDSIAASSYKSTRAGGRVRIGFDIAANTTATLNYTWQRNTIHGVGADASAAIKQSVPGYPDAASGSYDTSSIGYTIAYDSRDSMRTPVQGLYIATTQDLAGPGGDARHLRTVAEARGYYPITERVTLATRVLGGTITGYGGQDVRLVDLFYRGGETVRGFAQSGFGPRDILSANRDALGGANFLATSAELRLGLPFAPARLGGLSVALFADAGSLWGLGGSARGIPGVVGTTAALRASAGVGLAWDSPLGPLRVDYAQALVKQPFDKTQPLRFGLGPGF